VILGISLSIIFQYYREKPLWIPIKWNGLFMLINAMMILLLLKVENHLSSNCRYYIYLNVRTRGMQAASPTSKRHFSAQYLNQKAWNVWISCTSWPKRSELRLNRAKRLCPSTRWGCTYSSSWFGKHHSFMVVLRWYLSTYNFVWSWNLIAFILQTNSRLFLVAKGRLSVRKGGEKLGNINQYQFAGAMSFLSWEGKVQNWKN